MFAESTPFWADFWSKLPRPADDKDSTIGSARKYAKDSLLRNKDGSLFQITWVAHLLAKTEPSLAASITGVEFSWRNRLACLALLEASCTSSSGCLPLSSTSNKSESPFFSLFVQTSLAVVDSLGEDELQQETILQFVENYLLPDMVGETALPEIKKILQGSPLTDEATSIVEESINQWTMTTRKTQHASYISPMISLSVYKDENQKSDIQKKLMQSETMEESALLHPAKHLSVGAPFARPLPPPAFPLIGYEDDDYEAMNETDEAELTEYLHAELIWCIPTCQRLLLLPDDENADAEAQERFQKVLRLMQNQAFVNPLAPSDRRQVQEYLSEDSASNSNDDELTMRLVRESGLTPQNLPRIVEYNPLIAYECLVRILRLSPEDEKNEYLSSLVGMDVSLNSMEVVNRLATYNVEHPTVSPPATSTTTKREAVLHPEYIHLFIGSCIESCSNIQDRQAQNRLVRLVCVFVQALLRNKILEQDEIYFEVQSFCVEFSRIREASALFKSLKEHQGS